MFARATSRSYTCLKCQYRLALRESTRIESQNLVPRTPRRWQTSAATAIVEEEEDRDSLGDPFRDSTENRQRKPHFPRTRRLTPATQIAGEVLGKPAEILVLPARQKKKRKKSVGDDDQGVNPGVTEQEVTRKNNDDLQLRIHESLAQESKPGSMQEALDNINKIRDEAQKNVVDESLPGEKWAEYHRGLSTGFTKKQLDRYLDQHVGVLRSMTSDSTVSIKMYNRSKAATEIMTKLWGFPNNVPRNSSEHVSRSINLGRGGRELILGVDREWRRFLNHVTVELSSNPSDIEIAGPESWVKKATFVFNSLKKRVCSRTFVLPTVYEEALEEQGSPIGSAAHSILQELIQKYEITMTKRSEWTAYAFQPDRINELERQLILAQRKLPFKSESSTTSLSLSLDSDMDIVGSEVPVYKHILASQPSRWYRSSSLKVPRDNLATRQPTDAQSQAFQNTTASLKGHFYEKENITPSHSFSHNVATEFSATIGQALHTSPGSSAIDTDNSDTKTVVQRSSFASTIPMLRQFLAAQEVSPQQDPVNTGDLLSLNFFPYDPYYPEISVTATISFSTTSVEMNIESVRLAFASNTAYLAIPTASNDLQFSRLPFVTLFQRGNSVQNDYAPFLGELASQIRRQYDDEANPTRLNLKKLIDLDPKFLETPNDTKIESATMSGKSARSTVRYALDKAELLDKRRYKVSGQDDILLEHTSYLPLKVSAQQGIVEDLKVVPAVEKVGVVDGERFVEFVKSAVGVVGTLDGFVRERAEEIVRA